MGSRVKEHTELEIDGNKVDITHPDKPLWPDKDINKIHYLQYLREVSEFMLPFLRERDLTVIRYPHGVEGEKFFQKNCPEYAPDFVRTHQTHDIEYIVCSDLATLMWLGNQLAFEMHVPFQTIHSTGPSEIVLDLDPPSREKFELAIEAALIIKDILNRLHLISFVKTSGNKGLQVYIPLPENAFSYEDTRKFTHFIADYLTEKEPKWFTTERLKKNRGGRLYVDYLQHAEGKTIVAPYSVRGNEEALVATPLEWHEVTRDLRPEQFPMDVIQERLRQKGCPFQAFWEAKQNQPFEPVLRWLAEKGL
ncbi:MAG TPA: non-homologous end-joining DNA ligase [Bacillales bacterium]|nr:non-homologous end-joining DNA ligase [Bacillales bacterium]